MRFHLKHRAALLGHQKGIVRSCLARWGSRLQLGAFGHWRHWAAREQQIGALLKGATATRLAAVRWAFLLGLHRS